MLWYKSLHNIFMVTWFAGLFYLPRLFVYHAMSDGDHNHDHGDKKSHEGDEKEVIIGNMKVLPK